jgi:transposase
VEAVLYRYRAGIPWRDLPERFGSWKAVPTRFSRWAASGVWKRVFQHLAEEADNEYAMIDSTIVRAHQHSAGAKKKDGRDQAIGRSKGGLSTKIHATVDARGYPTGFLLTLGQACDLDGADVLLPALAAPVVLADKGYDAEERVLQPLAQAGQTAVIPPRANRKQPRAYGRELYKTRHRIENFFCQLKQFRAIATRYDKTARNFLAAIHLTATTIWLNGGHALVVHHGYFAERDHRGSLKESDPNRLFCFEVPCREEIRCPINP